MSESENLQGGDDAPDILEKTAYFDLVREQLQFWPYTIHQIDDTLDAGLIEARAKQLLFRAIHARNLTAFVGSGLSMSYGRLDWRNWETEQNRTVTKKAELFATLCSKALAWQGLLIRLLNPDLLKEDASETERKGVSAEDKEIAATKLWKALHPASGKPPLDQKHKHNVWQWLRGRERAIQAARNRMQKLSTTFALIKGKPGHFPGGEELPVKFEIAQQLHNELGDRTTLFLPQKMDEVEFDPDNLPEWGWAGARFSPRTDAPEAGLRLFRAYLAKNRKDLTKGVRKKFEEAEEDYREALTAFWRLNQRPEAKLDFETLSKTLLVDECPHAAILLRRGLLQNRDRDSITSAEDAQLTQLEQKLGVFDQSNQRRDIQGIREDAKRYRVLTPFLFDRAQILISQAQSCKGDDSPWGLYMGDVNERLCEYLERTKKANIERRYLTPSSRYLTALALALLDNPFDALGVKENGAFKPKRPPLRDKNGVREDDGPDAQDVDEKDPGHPLGPPRVESFSGRRSILAERYDPMPKIHRDLKVTRFITTNYDFEIERYFQDLGFRTFDDVPKANASHGEAHVIADSDMRRDELGRILRDRSFSPDQAAQLTSFAMASGESGADVMHLHGRSTARDGLVITERDYMRLYLTENEQRPTIDEGIQVAFSGSPLLFLGLGMEETDLLRPLRQFISNRDRTIGYTSIALLPAEKALEARTKFSASLYMRYGVHTVFYGGGQLSYGPWDGSQETEDATKYPIDWLHRIIELCNGLREELDRWEAKTIPPGRKREDILKDLIVKVGKLGVDLSPENSPGKEHYHKEGSALLVLLNQPQFRDGDQQPVDFGSIETPTQLASLAKELSDVKRHRSSGSEDPGPYELRNCDFKLTRPSKHRTTHLTEARTRISGKTYVGFYTRQLDRLLTMVMQLPSELGPKDDKTTRKAHCAPIRIALDGLQGAFITGSLNAALEGINQEKRAWWQSWQASPDYRLAEFQRLLPFEDKSGTADSSAQAASSGSTGVEVDPIKLGTVFLRHKLDNVLTPLDKAQDIGKTNSDLLIDDPTQAARLRPEYRTHVRSFDTFVAAVASTFKHRRKDVQDTLTGILAKERVPKVAEYETKRRQLITVAARRGMGKGTFMSAFCTPLGQHTYKRAAWPNGTDKDPVFFAGSIHINLGFSPEIASTFDMLMRTLIGLVVSLDMNISEEATPEDIEAQSEAYNDMHRKLSDDIKRLSRHAALTDLFAQFQQAATAYEDKHHRQPRLLLNICAAELLFDAQGQPKNREISRFIDLLFGEALSHCPLDIIIVADDAKLGGLWSDRKGKHNHPKRYLNRKRLDRFALEQISRALDGSRITMDENAEDSLARLDDPQALSTFSDYSDDANGAWEKPWPEYHFVHFTRPVNTAWLLIDNFRILALALHLLNPPGEGDNSVLDNEKEAFSDAVVAARDLSDRATMALWKKKRLPTAKRTALRRAIVMRCATRAVQSAIKEHAERLNETSYETDNRLNPSDLDSILRFRLYRDVNKKDAEEWRHIRRGLGNSRFSLTLLLAAAENTVVHAEIPMEGAERAERLLLDTVARVRTVGHERRDQLVLETALATYRGFHQIGDPDLDCDLHLLIIKHLGVIGTPVGSAVLVRLSEIRNYFSRIGIETETSRRRFIVRALTTMAHRGLVFRLDPHPRLVALSKTNTNVQYWPAEEEYRYALHRVVQSFALTALEAGPQEPVASNRFAPTLYASMPSQGPTLSRNSYRFLRSLIIGLSQYPDVPASEDSAEPWLFTTKELEVKVQAARSAVSLARSNFSVAVVSRLAIHDPVNKSVQMRGYLETYRVRLRWLIRIAYDLAQTKKAKNAPHNPDGPHKQVNVLYRDEIVWLYNELGVIAFAQGALSDALGYLRQASEANESIEGLSRSAPIYNHIDLNHAIVQLERGQFASARHRLQIVEQANKSDKCRLYHLARGYQCVLDHLQGRRRGLGKRYEQITQYFEREKEDRAAAIFLLHRARFLSHSAADGPDSLGLVQRARNLAHAGGHEDIRQHAELVAICVRLKIEGTGALTLRDQKVLLQIEDFSRRMSIWNLSVETLHVRAQILLAQNENMAAGRHLIRAMAIAKRHDMNLRLNGFMTTYARVLLLRGDSEGAALMAAQSLETAKRSGYALETSRAQDVIRDCEIGLNDNASAL